MPITAGTQTQVNTFTGGHQQTPQIVKRPDGGWVVTWQGHDVSYSPGVFQQVYDANGNPAGLTETGLNTVTDFSQADHKLTALESGGWVVTWTSDFQDGVDAGIFQRLYNADGTPANSTEQQVNTTFENSESSPSVTALAGGGWVVTWSSLSSTTYERSGYMQVFDAGGNKIGAEQRINNTTNVSDGGVEIAALSDGGWVVAWSHSNADYTTSVFHQRYDRNGVALSPQEEQVDTARGGMVTDVIDLAGGGYVISWSFMDPMFFDLNQTTYRVYDASGQPVSSTDAPFSADPTSFVADIAALPDGGWLATWTEDHGEVNLQAFNADGTPRMPAPIVVNPGASLQATYPQISVLEGGKWVVIWSAMDPNSYMADVYMQVFRRDGVAYDTPQIVSAQSMQYGVTGIAVTDVGDGRWTVAWGGYGVDGDGSGIAQRTFTITNSAPTARDATFDVTEDGSYRFSTASFGFTDADGHGLQAVIIAALPAEGSLKLNGQTVSANQQIAAADIPNLIWKPGADESGDAYATLSFKVVDNATSADGGAATSSAAYTITFNVTPVNDAPQTVNDMASMTASETKIIDVLANDTDTDTDGDELNVSLATVVSDNGAVTVNADGTLSVTYEGEALKASETAVIKILYFASDGTLSNPGTAKITVTGGAGSNNKAPDGEDGRVAVLEDGSYRFTKSTFGFSDPDGDALAAVVITALPGHGSLKLNGTAVNAGQRIAAADLGGLVYKPPADAHGDGLAALSFKVVDDGGTANGGLNTAEKARSITFDVEAVEDAPVVVRDSARMVEGDTLLLDVLANDRDADGDKLSIDSAAIVSNNGTVAVSADGTLSVAYAGADLAPGKSATITVLYSAIDTLLTGSGMATITVVGAYGEADTISGGKRSEKLVGTSASEALFGQGGKDTIRGGDGADMIDGGRGADRLWGGAGADIFVFGPRGGTDTIMDFSRRGANMDVIDLSDIAAITSFADLIEHHATDRGKGDVFISFDGDGGVLIKGITLEQLEAEMFLF